MKPLALLTLLLLPFASNSEEMNDQTNVEIPQGWTMNFNLGSASINPELSSQELGNSAFTFGMSFDYLNQDWYSSILIDIVNFDDDSGFTQDVVDSFGSESRASSSASATSIGGAFGKAWFVNNNKSMLYAQAGLNLILEASRSIDNCTDCREDDLDVEGGFFTRIGGQVFLDGFTLGVFSSFALSGDIDNSFGITAGFKY